MIRKDIEQLNVVEPYCFESDREEQWYNIGLKHGLEIADENPKSTWISTKDDLPCNHEEYLFKNRYTKIVVVYVTNCFGDKLIITARMILTNKGKWEWLALECNTVLYWMPIPEPPKE